MHGIKFCTHLFERSLLQRLFAFFLREWTRIGGIVNTEMGIRMHSLFFHGAVVARPDISPRTVISGVPRARYHIYQLVTPFRRRRISRRSSFPMFNFRIFNYYRLLLLYPRVFFSTGRRMSSKLF